MGMKRLFHLAFCITAGLFLTAGNCDMTFSDQTNETPPVTRENGEIQGDCLLWDGWTCTFDMLDIPLALGSRVALTHVPAESMPIANSFISTQDDVLRITGQELRVIKAGRAAVIALSDRYEALDWKNTISMQPFRADIVRADLGEQELSVQGPDQILAQGPHAALDLQVILRGEDGSALGGLLDWEWTVDGPFHVDWISMDGRSIRLEALADGVGSISVEDPGTGFKDRIDLVTEDIGGADAGPDAGDAGSDGSDASDASDGSDDGGADA